MQSELAVHPRQVIRELGNVLVEMFAERTCPFLRLRLGDLKAQLFFCLKVSAYFTNHAAAEAQEHGWVLGKTVGNHLPFELIQVHSKTFVLGAKGRQLPNRRRLAQANPSAARNSRARHGPQAPAGPASFAHPLPQDCSRATELVGAAGSNHRQQQHRSRKGHPRRNSQPRPPAFLHGLCRHARAHHAHRILARARITGSSSSNPDTARNSFTRTEHGCGQEARCFSTSSRALSFSRPSR